LFEKKKKAKGEKPPNLGREEIHLQRVLPCKKRMFNDQSGDKGDLKKEVECVPALPKKKPSGKGGQMANWKKKEHSTESPLEGETDRRKPVRQDPRHKKVSGSVALTGVETKEDRGQVWKKDKAKKQRKKKSDHIWKKGSPFR